MTQLLRDYLLGEHFSFFRLLLVALQHPPHLCVSQLTTNASNIERLNGATKAQLIIQILVNQKSQLNRQRKVVKTMNDPIPEAETVADASSGIADLDKQNANFDYKAPEENRHVYQPDKKFQVSRRRFK